MQSRFLKQLIFTGVALVLFLLVLEALARLFGDKPQIIEVQDLRPPGPPAAAQSLTIPKIADFGLYTYQPTGKRLRPNTKAVILNHATSGQDVIIETNSLGYRYRELERKTRRHFRVLVLGDSITVADYVPESDTYPAAIERYLQAHQNESSRLRGKQIEVVNAGVGAIGLETELAILMETGLGIQPDIVLIGLYLNDASESLALDVARRSPLMQRSYLLSFLARRFEILRKRQAVERFRIAHSADEWENERQLFLEKNPGAKGDWAVNEAAFNKLIYDNFDDWGFAWSRSAWRKIQTLMRLFQEAERENGFQLRVLLLPTLYQAVALSRKNEPQAHFEALMTSMNIPHFDMLPALRKKFQDDGVNIYYDHCHMVPEGNAFAGQLAGAFLLREMDAS